MTMTRITSSSFVRVMSVSTIVLAFLTPLRARQIEAGSQEQDKATRTEEAEDYFQKWLREDVIFIITPQEREVFEKLATPEEKDSFIELFWFRRDPDPRTSENEFKEEHYRRIAYANERFYSGEPGWMTDRGRVYIIHGPPDEIESYPAGGTYNRPMHEGGGSTLTYPFEIWWYRHIEGMGNDIELEFVDRNGGNHYRLALDPNYKDALLHIRDAGPTMAEQLGIAKKEDRPFFSPWNRETYPLMFKRAKDNPFERYETFVAVQRAKEIKYRDLQELVKVDISYNNLPFEVRQDHFNLNETQVIVPITVEWDNRDLGFDREGSGFVARLGVYAMVTSIGKRIVAEFEEEVTTSLPAERFDTQVLGRSIYQRILILDKKTRCRLDLVVKDLNNGNVGAVRQVIIPPSFGAPELTASSLMLSDFVQKLADIPRDNQMFVLGDLRIRPSISRTFSLQNPLAVYLQVYHFGLDQSTLSPRIEVKFSVFRDSRLVLEVSDETGESVDIFSEGRLVLLRQLPVAVLNPGKYRLEVRVRDLINDQEVASTEEFELTAS